MPQVPQQYQAAGAQVRSCWVVVKPGQKPSLLEEILVGIKGYKLSPNANISDL